MAKHHGTCNHRQFSAQCSSSDCYLASSHRSRAATSKSVTTLRRRKQQIVRELTVQYASRSRFSPAMMNNSNDGGRETNTELTFSGPRWRKLEEDVYSQSPPIWTLPLLIFYCGARVTNFTLTYWAKWSNTQQPLLANEDLYKYNFVSQLLHWSSFSAFSAFQSHFVPRTGVEHF